MPEYLFLNEQRGLYDAQSKHVEAWKTAHVEAMQCREIEDAIHLGLMILANIRRHNEQWASSWVFYAADAADWHTESC